MSQAFFLLFAVKTLAYTSPELGSQLQLAKTGERCLEGFRLLALPPNGGQHQIRPRVGIAQDRLERLDFGDHIAAIAGLEWLMSLAVVLLTVVRRWDGTLP